MPASSENITSNPMEISETEDALGISTFLELKRLGFLDFMIKNWHDLGDIYRFKIGPESMIVVASAEATRQISFELDYFTKGKNFDKIRAYAGGRNLLTSVGEDWQWQRKLLSPQFTPKFITRYADIMMQEVNDLLASWDEKSDEPVDVETDMFRISTNVTLRAIFSSVTDDDFDSIRDDVRILIEFLTKRQQAFIQLPLWFPNKTIRQYNAAHKRLYDFLSDIIETRLQQPRESWGDDMLSRTLQAVDPDGNQMSHQIVKDQCLTFFVGGYEAAALTMMFAIYLLSQHPQIEQRVIDEIHSVTQGDMPTLDDMRQMPYLLQVIKETMRLYPPVPYYPRDVVKDTILDGYEVKGGDALLVFTYGIHHNPKYWHNPDKFDPDRFLPEAESQRHPQAYVPFGSGRRICIGNHFGLLECQVALSMIYSRYRLRTTENYQPDLMATGLLQLRNGMPMILEQQ